MTKARAKAKSLTPSKIRKLLVRCQLMQNPELKRVVLALSFSTLRVSELAQLTVDDVLMPTGKIKEEIYLRASLCKRRKPRSIWLSKLAKQMIQEWVDYRKSHNWATTFNNTYQRLNPLSKLVLNNRARSYSMKRKTRINQAGEQVDYQACDVLELMIRNIYQRSGLKGCSSHTGRRSYGSNMNAQGVELNAIQRALGHSEPSMSLEYIDISTNQLSKAAELAL
ncbi:putative site-specific recombinase [Vibrio crassostreae]|jgi:site-specific recombinase XerD|uniref:tyrosine-type recombinase/integrase n=1 Tax=Vibrio crassostreae TaxID=246167 RepID=UPI0010450F85|nr:site-specific integrase [Vibrio crassostreae]NOH77868.1 site-specific integrase [Vibrio crassostreae]TCN92670.1 phage integrase family protein [Vibrio crassostreae]CAK2502012.1 putative site-specific recombinase [Vibrio crassostreae]CAK2609550.1 putative site-specific recombinase [Vibrio crassostreae]CAK2610355.1 putative site-specific recombinase [Vibrio crassostreae]